MGINGPQRPNGTVYSSETGLNRRAVKRSTLSISFRWRVTIAPPPAEFKPNMHKRFFFGRPGAYSGHLRPAVPQRSTAGHRTWRRWKAREILYKAVARFLNNVSILIRSAGRGGSGAAPRRPSAARSSTSTARCGRPNINSSHESVWIRCGIERRRF